MKLRERGPDHERERLRALGCYELLESDGTSAIDALVRLVSRSCGVPIALVGLIDERRERLLSIIGWSGVREIPREMSVCTQTIEQDDLLVVEDLSRDPRFRALPMVVEGPRVRFYAGVPLINPQGYALGTLCVVDREPRTLDASQLAALKDIAVAVTELLEARRSAGELRRALEAVRTLAAEREQARLRAEGRNQLLQLAEDVAEVGHWRVDLKEQRVFWSPQVYRIHGQQAATFQPNMATSIESYQPDDRETVVRALARAAQTHQPFDLDLQLLRTDGAVRRVHCRGRDEVDPDTGESIAIFGVLQDITDRERVRELSERRDRLVTTGTLAAGIGHEINNPLTFMTANLDFALEELGGTLSGPYEELIEVLREARQGADRIRTIVRGLRAFAREEAMPISTDVASTVEVSVNVAMHELRHRVTLVKDYAPVSRVLADDVRLSQVVVNLLTNAAHSFVTSDTTQNRVYLSTTQAPDGRVAIEVRDNGAGIPPDVLPRIFDPFFTTKPAGEGTGLGLSICHNVVTALGGEILCTTAVGQGTTFRVLLPAAEPEGEDEQARAQPRSGRADPLRPHLAVTASRSRRAFLAARTSAPCPSRSSASP